MGLTSMAEYKEQGNLVFGLDIGTRSIVGTVGYREGDVFTVLGQEIKALGFNMDFAPVSDVNNNPANPTISGRWEIRSCR